MIADCQAVLDACVLIPMPVADTLLRLAESPRLYRPRWTERIMGEVTRNLIKQFNLSEGQTKYREGELRKHFPDAWVQEYEPLIPAMTNDAGDRHVLAAAVRSNADVIVTYNRKHFPASALETHGIECLGPSSFLRQMYELSPGLVVKKLHEQAENIGLSFEDFLTKLRAPVPGFVSHLCSVLNLAL